MKKNLLILLILATSLISCSNNDEGSSSSDKIIGTWGNYKEVYLPTNEISNYSPYYSIDTFKSDGSTSSKFSGTEVKGSWENLGDGVYKLSLGGISVNQNIEFVGNDEMIIYDSNTNDKWAYYYERTND
jgi:hypothetical protein